MAKSALIVVDMQNDFITGSLALKNSPAKEDAEEIVETINSIAMLPGWDLVVYSLDWHPNNHISFVTNAHRFTQHKDSKINVGVAEVYDEVVFSVGDNSSKRVQVMWPPHCIQDSWGARLHNDIHIPKGSHFVKKGISVTVDSYSAFFDNGHLQETELRELLLSNGIERVFICGVATDVCVNFTASDSHDLGFQTFVIEDACRGVNASNIETTFNKFKSLGLQIISSSEVAAHLCKSKPIKNEAISQMNGTKRPESC